MTEVEIRSDFKKALDSVKNGTELSDLLGYGFNVEDIRNLALICKEDTENRYRQKIIDLLEDCNFHSENKYIYEGKYDELIEKLDAGYFD